MEERNLVDLFLTQADRYRSKTALRVKRGGSYQDISWTEFKDQVLRVSDALRRLGVQKGDRIALLSENRPEWAYVDLGTLSLGAVLVPIHVTSSAGEIKHILNHCRASILFLSSTVRAPAFVHIRKELTHLKHVIMFDEERDEGLGCENLGQLLKQGGPQSGKKLYEMNEIGQDDLATIIYTSGTTGPSKGVMLTHGNLLVNCHDVKKILPIGEHDVYLSFLPLSHVFERMGGYYLGILCGATVAYAESMLTAVDNMREIRPTVACAVPRFFEKFFEQIRMPSSETSPLVSALRKWALQVADRNIQDRIRNRHSTLLQSIQFSLANRVVYSKIRNTLGGRIRFFVSGGAPLNQELAEFFYSMGLLILEGYGLTETSPVISVNSCERFKFGSVGVPLEHVETKIQEDGEIAVRGPSIMRSYYEDEASTKSAIRNGWFHTGDLGRIDEDGFLFIVGRKKDIIVTSGGKNVAPQNIENAILRDPVMSQMVVVGDRHHFLTALIVPNFKAVRSALGLSNDASSSDLVRRPDVHELIAKRIEERTTDLASYEKIKYFSLLAREFSQDQDEVTLTLKIKRQVVAKHYEKEINLMYESVADDLNESRNRIFYIL